MSKSPNDYYRVLQVDPAAEPEVIKAAYHRLAEKYHPDKAFSPDAVDRMQEINEAYETLGDITKRAKYDRKRLQLKSSIAQSSYKETATMATLNFEELKKKYNKNATVEEIMPSDSNQLVARRKSDGAFVVIRREDAENRNIADYSDYITNQTDIVKAGHRRELLERDLLLFNAKFPSAEVDIYPDKGHVEYIVIKNFHLPETYTSRKGKEKYYVSPTEDIVVILADYPDSGPHGVHIRRDSLNRKKIEKALRRGHVFDEKLGGSEDTTELEKLGWDWLCFHYDREWDFRPKNINEGDCLAKYFINLYVALSGEFPDEDD